MADLYRVVCGWCHAHLSGPLVADPAHTSHGICASCAERVLAAHRASPAWPTGASTSHPHHPAAAQTAAALAGDQPGQGAPFGEADRG